MSTDTNIKKDAEDAYQAGQMHWSQYWQEAKLDIQMRDGKPHAADEAYLKSQDREYLNFRKAHRIVNVVTGYEQKNLMALKIDPIEGADEKTASQFSGLIMHNMLMGGGYAAMSGAFEFGPVVSGMNLLETWVDRSDDLLNGDIRFRRLPYNRYVLDPTFTDRDLDIDCGFVYTRDFFSKGQCAGLLPEMANEILRLKGSPSDSKFGEFYPLKGKNNEYNLKYDRFYTKTFRPYQILADRGTGRMIPIDGKNERALDIVKAFMNRFPQLALIKGMRKGVDLHIFIEGHLMYSGLDPSGLDEYPFVLEAGYWTPEDDDPKYRMQGVMRCMRDPGREVNRRRAQIVDLLDAVIRQGWKVKDGKVVNQEELYSTGHAVIVMDPSADMMDAQQLQMPSIPQGVFQAIELLDRDHDEIPGVNSEMLGSPEDKDVEVAAILAKLRSANGLTTLQGLFSSHRYAKVLMGRKQVRVIQKNFTPSKVARLLSEQPTKEFYDKDFGKYDCTPTEAPLTDSQRQQHYAQLLAYKKMGAPITWEMIFDYGPMEYKDKFKEAVKRNEQGQAKQMQADQQLQAVTTALMNAQKFQTMAKGKENLAQAEENRQTAILERAKAMKEIETIDFNNFIRTLTVLQGLVSSIKGDGQPQPPQQTGPARPPAGLENMPTMGRA